MATSFSHICLFNLLLLFFAVRPFAVQYNLSHLSQDDSQNVCGPIQDDEGKILVHLRDDINMTFRYLF